METNKTSHYVIRFFGLNMISIVGVFHVGHRSQRIVLEGQTQPWMKPYFLPPFKKIKKIKNPNTCNNSRASAASLFSVATVFHYA